MAHLICYDISGNTLRNRIAQRLIGEGFERINLSVYLGQPTESSLTSLLAWCCDEFKRKANPKRDSLVAIPLTESQIYRMIVIGTNDLDPDELTGNKSTLIV